MPQINNTVIYPFDEMPGLMDFVIGTNYDTSNKRTQNFRINSIIQLINSVNGVSTVQFLFSNGSNEDLTYESVGTFFTNTNEVQVGQFTQLIFNKSTLQPLDLSLLFNRLNDITNLAIKLTRPDNPSNFFGFRVSSIENMGDYFVFNVTPIGNFYLGDLENEKIYTLQFDTKGEEENNIITVKNFIYDDNDSEEEILGHINNIATYEVNEHENIIFKGKNLRGTRILKYFLANKGKGHYGAAGEPLSIQDIELVYNNAPTLGEIGDDPTTDIVDFPPLTGLTVYDWLNTLTPSITIQPQDEGYTLFQGVIDGENISYLWIGEPGTYGFGQGQADSPDFQELSAGAPTPYIPSLNEVTAVGNFSDVALVVRNIVGSAYRWLIHKANGFEFWDKGNRVNIEFETPTAADVTHKIKASTDNEKFAWVSDILGLSLGADSAENEIYLLDADGQVLATLDVSFLGTDDGRTISINSTNNTLELKDVNGTLLSSVPVSTIIADTVRTAAFNGTTPSLLQYRNAANQVMFSVNIGMANVDGLNAAITSLNNNKLNKGANTEYENLADTSEKYGFTLFSRLGAIFRSASLLWDETLKKLTIAGTQAVWEAYYLVTDGNMGIKVLEGAVEAFKLFDNFGNFISVGTVNAKRLLRIFVAVRYVNGNNNIEAEFIAVDCLGSVDTTLKTFEVPNNSSLTLEVRAMNIFNADKNHISGYCQLRFVNNAGTVTNASLDDFRYGRQYSTIKTTPGYVVNTDTRIDATFTGTTVSLKLINTTSKLTAVHCIVESNLTLMPE
jgi:hypothetical protein